MSKHFTTPDALLVHLRTTVATLGDPMLIQKYTGLVCVMAVAGYELAIKEVFITFGIKKHKVLGSFVASHFEKLNGRIRLNDLKNDYLPRFGERYRVRFDNHLEKAEKSTLRASGRSMKASYGNIITWRHQFAHEGQLPNNASFIEAADSYELGKLVVTALQAAMTH